MGCPQRKAYVLILSFPSVWLCQVKERKENTDQPWEAQKGRDGGLPRPGGGGAGRGWEAKTPIGLELEEEMWHIGLGEERQKTWGISGRPSSYLVMQHIMYTGDTAEMVFELWDDISKCLGRLELGALFGYSWTPSRGAWVTSFLGGPLTEGWETEPRERAVRMLTLDPYLSRERVPSGWVSVPSPRFQLALWASPPTPEARGQTQLCSYPPCPAAALQPKQKGLGYTHQ